MNGQVKMRMIFENFTFLILLSTAGWGRFDQVGTSHKGDGG